MNEVKFHVTDIRTGEYPDLASIALGVEEWAWRLDPHAIDGFYMSEDGRLLVRDKCGNYADCPRGRFSVHFIAEFDRVVSCSFVY